jgi:hypothetical protein
MSFASGLKRRVGLAALAAPLISVVISAPAFGFICQNRLFEFRSMAEGKWVTTEVDDAGGDNGMLRARAATPGPWEVYRVVCLGSGEFAIRSVENNRYVSAELGYTGSRYAMLRARATSIGPYERFRLQSSLDYTNYSDGYLWSVANGRYVSAEIGYAGNLDGMLRARSAPSGPWERYQIHWAFDA